MGVCALYLCFVCYDWHIVGLKQTFLDFFSDFSKAIIVFVLNMKLLCSYIIN